MTTMDMVSRHILGSIRGISGRQLHFWIQQGYLLADQPSPGSGNSYEWPEGEVRVARMMARLVVAGFQPAAAAEHARWLCQREVPLRMQLPGGMVLEVGDEP